MDITMPGGVARRNMKNCNPLIIAQVADFILQPCSLLLPILVTLQNTMILDVRVRLVLSAVKSQETDACSIESVVKLPVMRWKILIHIIRVLPSVFMVSAHIFYRDILCEHIHAGIQPSAENLFLILCSCQHISIKQNKVILGEVHIGT